MNLEGIRTETFRAQQAPSSTTPLWLVFRATTDPYVQAPFRGVQQAYAERTRSLTPESEPQYIGAYSSSKAAVGSLTSTLRVELAPFGIKVISLISMGTRSESIRKATGGSLPATSAYLPIRTAAEASTTTAFCLFWACVGHRDSAYNRPAITKEAS